MRHNNKYWLREKFYLSLLKEQDAIYHDLSWRRASLSGRLKELDDILTQRFYNKYCGKFDTAPHWYRNMLNRKRRVHSKQVVHKIISGYIDIEDYIFDDNYKDAPWYW